MRYKVKEFLYRSGSKKYVVYRKPLFALFWEHYASFDDPQEAEECIRDLAGWPKISTYARYDADGERVYECW